MRFKLDQTWVYERGPIGSENRRCMALRESSRGQSVPGPEVCLPYGHHFLSDFLFFFFHSRGEVDRGCCPKADRVTRTPRVASPAPCLTTTLVNRVHIHTDTLQQRTPKRRHLMPLTPTLQPLSPGTARPGPTTPTCLRNIGQPQRRPFPAPRRPVVRLQTLPIEVLVSRPPILLQVMQTR